MLRWPLTACSRFITRDFLNLPAHSLIERYSYIGLTFYLSGVVHEFGTATVGIPYPESGATAFFSLFVIAIMIEDSVQALYSNISKREKSKSTPLWGKILGYIWVIFWFTLTTPGFTYDLIHIFANSPKFFPGAATEVLGKTTAGSLLLLGGVVLKVSGCMG